MSLDTVVADIREEAEQQAEQIIQEAKEEAKAIIDEAEADAEGIREEREREIERQIDQEREQKLSSANLEAKQQRLEARRDVLEDVRAGVEEEIATLEEGREELTRALLEAALAEFDDDASVEVYGRSDDAALLESVVADYDGCEYAGEFDCLGGVVAEATGARIRVNNTFDSVLADVWEDNLREVSERLFEQ
jgi:V/A-type H+-transporting ATPase subunit E